MPRERIAKHLSERAPTDDGFHGNRPRYQQPCELRQPHSPHIALRKRFQVAPNRYVTTFGTKKTFYAEQNFYFDEINRAATGARTQTLRCFASRIVSSDSRRLRSVITFSLYRYHSGRRCHIQFTTRSDNDTVSSGQVAKNTAQRQETQLFIKILPPEISGLKPSTTIR